MNQQVSGYQIKRRHACFGRQSIDRAPEAPRPSVYPPPSSPRWFHWKRLFPVALLLVVCISPAIYAESVELSVVPTDRASFGAVQKWAQALSKLRNVRVRSNTTAKRVREEAKWVGSTLYITALIGPSDQLYVPGKKFSMRQTKSLAAWIEEQKTLRQEGGKEAKDQKFGLTATELTQVHEMLKPPVTASTDGATALAALGSIVRSQKLPLLISDSARRRLSQSKLKTEWKDLSSGAALAGILRTAELDLVPRVKSGQVELQVLPQRRGQESWPVGWPPEQKKDKIVPKLFETLPVEIYDTPVRDVMRALSPRIETPILFDEGLLTAAELDPDKTLVTVKPGRSFYGKVIRQAAFNAKMKSELRIDERGKGFFWITAAVTKR